MRVYYIYSFKDEKTQTVMNKIDGELKDDRYRSFRFPAGSVNRFWKHKARKKLKTADLVIFFLSSTYTKNSDNINYELRFAERLGKMIICVQVDDTEAPGEEDGFNNVRYVPYKVMKADKAVEYIRKNFHEYDTKDLVFKDKDPESMSYDDQLILFEQYKQMFESTESLMERRQNTSSFYISINTVLVTIIAAVFALGIDTRLLFAMGAVISLFGIIISKTWYDTLVSYDRINFSKFNVLEAMEKYLPASMFYAEYKDSKNDMIKHSVPSYSERERIIPRMFKLIYFSLFLVMALLFIGSIFGLIPSDIVPSIKIGL